MTGRFEPEPVVVFAGIRSVQERFQEIGLVHRPSLIRYHDFDAHHNELLRSFHENPQNLVFCKDNSLAYQMEYRFVVERPELKAPVSYELGDLSEFARLMTAKEFFSEDMLITLERYAE